MGVEGGETTPDDPQSYRGHAILDTDYSQRVLFPVEPSSTIGIPPAQLFLLSPEPDLPRIHRARSIQGTEPSEGTWIYEPRFRGFVEWRAEDESWFEARCSTETLREDGSGGGNEEWLSRTIAMPAIPPAAHQTGRQKAVLGMPHPGIPVKLPRGSGSAASGDTGTGSRLRIPPPVSYLNIPGGNPSPTALISPFLANNLPAASPLLHGNGPDLILILPPDNTLARVPFPSTNKDAILFRDLMQTYTAHRGRWSTLKHLRHIRIVTLPRAHVEVMEFPHQSLLRGIRNPKMATKRVEGLEKEVIDSIQMLRSGGRGGSTDGLALELVEGWSLWRLTAAVVVVVGLAGMTASVWKVCGGEGGVLVGLILGISVLLVGAAITGAWIAVSW
ncbi:hypothetical protein BZA05DRAFT_19114 [Tricharina praecox]|uniref:uncharacterized protein n=1 Tax=Tricharina praecox TaxID=43433 RepID=UPI002220572A|nr:uncharacterized protein BZA05DRAFT_19114 [Tricharina praecox]KAI5858981.1 hypothetical protein BZA05DRAFT_19114 [Tricharina praecox]